MRKEEIEELIRLVESSQINELEVCEGRKKIRISKGGPAATTSFVPAPALPQAASIARNDEMEETTESPHGEDKLASNLKQIKSPMVGTFYRSPAPGSESFTEVGQASCGGTDSLHRRGDEAHERDRLGLQRRHSTRSGRKWSAGGVRAAAVSC